MLDQATPAITRFDTLLRATIEGFKEGLARDPEHPFFGAVPEDYEIKLWATVLNRGGYHPPHHHPGNWLSGVYYVKVPESAAEPGGRNGSEAFPGGLVFDGFTNLPGLSGHSDLVRRITPVEGLLVLFPSYFMHATVPFAGDDTRISLAFDVMPQ